jgi:hypothetical protein
MIPSLLNRVSCSYYDFLAVSRTIRSFPDGTHLCSLSVARRADKDEKQWTPLAGSSPAVAIDLEPRNMNDRSTEAKEKCSHGSTRMKHG